MFVFVVLAVGADPTFTVTNLIPDPTPAFVVVNRMPAVVPADAGKEVTWPDTTGRPCRWLWYDDPARPPKFLGYADATPGGVVVRPFQLPGAASPTTRVTGVTSPGAGYPSTSFPAAGQYRGATSTPTLRAIPGGTWTSSGCVSPFG